MSKVTEQIAEGRFDHHLPVERKDELGLLAGGINRMAERLAGFVNGQKRFLGDIAHELCAPIARIQFALGILEQRSEPGTVDDLHEEVRQMSELVSELLSFSKTGMEQSRIQTGSGGCSAKFPQNRPSRAKGWPTQDRQDRSRSLKVARPDPRIPAAIDRQYWSATQHRYAGQTAGPVTISARREKNE